MAKIPKKFPAKKKVEKNTDIDCDTEIEDEIVRLSVSINSSGEVVGKTWIDVDADIDLIIEALGVLSTGEIMGPILEDVKDGSLRDNPDMFESICDGLSVINDEFIEELMENAGANKSIVRPRDVMKHLFSISDQEQ